MIKKKIIYLFINLFNKNKIKFVKIKDNKICFNKYIYFKIFLDSFIVYIFLFINRQKTSHEEPNKILSNDISLSWSSFTTYNLLVK